MVQVRGSNLMVLTDTNVTTKPTATTGWGMAWCSSQKSGCMPAERREEWAWSSGTDQMYGASS